MGGGGCRVTSGGATWCQHWLDNRVFDCYQVQTTPEGNASTLYLYRRLPIQGYIYLWLLRILGTSQGTAVMSSTER